MFFYSRGTEGFGWGKTNDDGFVNAFDYTEDTQVDVLIMGSSEMESFNLPITDSAASRLNALLPEETVYNIGISAHNFFICLDNLEAALQRYRPQKYVVIETPYISFTDANLTRAIEGKTPGIVSNTNGILAKLQKIPYLRLIYAQINHFMDAQRGGGSDPENIGAESAASDTNRDSEQLVRDVILKICQTAQSYGVQAIVLYHPGVSIQPDGALTLKTDTNASNQFRRLCRENGVLFVDMSDRFLQEYAKDYTVPCGFSNTPAGSGHMNQYGHAMVADELYKLIKGVE